MNLRRQPSTQIDVDRHKFNIAKHSCEYSLFIKINISLY